MVALSKKLWQRVTKGPSCWEWTGMVQAGGYGRIEVTVSFKVRKHALAHRVAWELTYGPIPEGMYVCHRCDNPRCVRPEHLFLGSAADNNHDMRDKGRAAAGPRHALAKLTYEQVAELRRRLTDGEPTAEVAAAFGIRPATANNIARGKTWQRADSAVVQFIRVLCPVCLRVTERAPGKGRNRTYCTTECRDSAMYQRRAARRRQEAS